MDMVKYELHFPRKLILIAFFREKLVCHSIVVITTGITRHHQHHYRPQIHDKLENHSKKSEARKLLN